VWSALGIVYVVWGSTYLFIRIMVRTIPPVPGAGLRFVLAGLLLLVFLRHRIGAVTRAQLVGAGVVGCLLAAGGNGLVTVAERHVPSGLAALLVASVPLWIVLWRRLFGDRERGVTLLGVLIGFVGVAVLLAPGARPHGVPIASALLIVLAGALWGLGSVLAQRLEMPSDALVSTGLQMLVGGLLMVVLALPTGGWSGLHVGQISGESAWSLAYLVVIGSCVAYSAYAWLLANAPISTVSTYAYVNPLVAVLLGWAVLSESISWETLAGAALIIPAVALIVRSRARPSPGTTPPRPAPSARAADAAPPAAGPVPAAPSSPGQ